MRTTIDLPDDVLGAAKERAVRERRSLSEVVTDAVRSMLAQVADASAEPVRLTTFRGDGIQPGVDLDDSASLLDLMERRA